MNILLAAFDSVGLTALTWAQQRAYSVEVELICLVVYNGKVRRKFVGETEAQKNDYCVVHLRLKVGEIDP